MPRYEVTSPDGQRYEVNAPEGATEQDAIAYIKNQQQGEPQQAVAPSALGSEPLPSLPQRLQQLGQAGVMGAMRGGPFAVLPAVAMEGQRQYGQGIDRAAYEAGGQVTDVATSMGVPPHVAAGFGYLTNVATGAAPMFLGGAVTKGLPLGMEKLGINIMQKAVKPSMTALKTGEWGRAGRTMLEKGIGATRGGISKLDDLIDSAISKVDDAIDAVGPGRMVNRDSIKRELVGELQNIRKRIDVGDDPRVIAQLWQRIKSRFDDMIPLERAQEAKKAEMAFLRNKNVYQKDMNPALMAGREAAARGLKKGIEDVVPEIKQLNKELGDLLTVRNVVSPKVEIQGNKDMVGAFAPISVAAGRGDAIGTAMAVTQLADRNPWFKSWLARTIFNIPGPVGLLGGGAIGISGALPEK